LDGGVTGSIDGAYRGQAARLLLGRYQGSRSNTRAFRRVCPARVCFTLFVSISSNEGRGDAAQHLLNCSSPAGGPPFSGDGVKQVIGHLHRVERGVLHVDGRLLRLLMLQCSLAGRSYRWPLVDGRGRHIGAVALCCAAILAA
jgi:hypothetical protein